MTISGAFFPKEVRLRISLSSGESAIVTTNASGAFRLPGLAAPATPGNYTVDAVRADGTAQSGLPKVASFSVVSRPQLPAQPVEPGTDPPPAPDGTGGDGNFPTGFDLRCGGRTVTLVGTSGRDVIEGWAGRDVIAGLGGNDVISGLAGNDVISGLAGNDVICGGRGRDRLIGGRGDDRLAGGPGRDRLLGGRGRDRLSGGGGADLCVAGPGLDLAARC